MNEALLTLMVVLFFTQIEVTNELSFWTDAEHLGCHA